MPFCSYCGAPVEGRFCARCGTPLAGEGHSPPLIPTAGLSDRAASALCYALGFITGALFLLLQPYNRNRTVRFHALQSIFFSIAWVIIIIAANIFFGTIRLFFIPPLVQLALFVFWIYLIVVTWQGRTLILPVIGPLARQQANRVS